MLELGISQVQTQLTKLLDKSVMIVDKKTKKRRAVMIPYHEYEALRSNQKSNINSDFEAFVGALDSDFVTKDIRYRDILK